MAKYIECEAALRCVQRQRGPCRSPAQNQMLDFLKAAIEHIPAADVVPVVHGRWEFLGPNRFIKECMCGTCSVCKVRSKYIVNTMLCPNCGAIMEGSDS